MLQNNIFSKCIESLGLKRPINIQIKTKKNKAEGVYWATYSKKRKNLTHNIIIYNVGNNTRDLDTLIAHELIHAWQEESGLAKEIHGKFFKKAAKIVSEAYNLPEIYIKGVDK